MRRVYLVFCGLVPAVLVAVVAGTSIGAAPIPISHVLDLLLSSHARAADPAGAQILLELRLPRVLAAILAGASLSVSGCGLQALLRNPLADPYVLGVSAGASLGAAIVIAAGVTMALSGLAVPGAAILGAVLATALVFGAAQSRGALPGTVLLLAGVVTASVLGSLVSIVLFASAGSDRMQQIVLWTMGGFGEADWPRVLAVLPITLAGSLLLWALGRDINLLSFGEDPARYLGANVENLKRGILIVCAVLTGGAVALGGVIGFVGLIVPHACRKIVGPNHRVLLPASFLAGGAFLALADLVARTFYAPTELPVGLLTGLIGGPFFLALMRSARGGK
ncbi:MAG TPA: iron ABC transporter permease [Armatimonadota bacterium]|jgi:iron complex transport system permease protein